MPDLRHACMLAQAFGDWDPKAALPHLVRLEHATIAGYAAGSEKELAGVCIASLTSARDAAGDASALADYGAWIVHTKPADADFELEQWFHPMIAHPTAAPVARAASVLFAAPSPWVPFVTDKSGYSLERILELDLLKVAAFRRHVLAELVDKKKIGTITMKSRDSVEVKTASFTSSRGTDAKDPLTPPDGTTMDLRVCDEYAATLSSPALHLPTFRVYWPVAERDRALAAILVVLRRP